MNRLVLPTSAIILAVFVVCGCSTSRKAAAKKDMFPQTQTTSQMIPKYLNVRAESGDQLVLEGTSATLTVDVKGKGKRPIFYQWYLQGEAIPGAVTNVYTISELSTNNIGYYTCYATDGKELGLSEPMQVMMLTTNASFMFITARPGPVYWGFIPHCPGYYSGYVNFYVGALATSTSGTATAMWSPCSAIAWYGEEDWGCCLGSSCTFSTVPEDWYGFTAYFPLGSPPLPGGYYTLRLNGFAPP